VHRAYAKHAEVTVPSLDDWEREWTEKAESEKLNAEMSPGNLLAVDFQSPLAANAESK